MTDQRKIASDFLAENANQDGITSTASGLQYKILKQGSGKKPAAHDQVQVHYAGRLHDGTTFDSSYSRGTPATFGVRQVIPGWTEALQLMSEGDKWEVYIKPELGSGEGGYPGVIPGNALLIFEVELLQVL